MKKPLVFVAAACACALALHADFAYDNVFNAIGSGATGTNDLKSTGGSWVFTNAVGQVALEGGSLAFDLEENKSIEFTVTDGAAPDTNTVVKVEVKSLLSEVNTNHFPTAAEMETRQAQLGFVVGINAAETPIATNYYAWTGGASWTLLSHPEGAEPSVTNETDFIVTFNYMTNNSHSVQFDIVRGGTTNQLNGGAALPLTSTRGAAAGNVAGMRCYGSGSLKSADGSVGLAVAVLSDNVRYGSLADAVTAAGTSETTVTVVRDTSEGAEIPEDSNITISDPGEKVKGTITVPGGTTVKVDTTVAQLDPATNGVYTIPLKTSGGTVVVKLPDSIAQYKEVASNVTVSADNGIDVEIYTKSSIMQSLNPGTDKALVADETKLREFMNTYANEAYAAAHADEDSLTQGLQANGDNGIPLWESYVLGIAPTDSVAPVTVPAGDPSTSQITLAIPAIVTNNYSGDYTVTYQAVGGTSGASTADPQSIAVPLGTGTYTIKATLTPKSE
ncbi:MAG: hypothetical protein IJG13_21355 [Kiritimatiellae bacterium]|nr:hypothetical protein [Kiritimatiellia bacterium]MBQ6328893.1 hypothetical protein [Kiritimatiellia bacterium]